jgi:monoamine oxidase
VKYDVAVVGAGVAGLAAARTLSGAGRRVCLIEARNRVGGRIQTLHVPDLPLPIELGAEFIHGEAHETFAIVEAAALTTVELPDTHIWSRDSRWEALADFWERIDRVRKMIKLKRDISFDEFLRTRRSMKPQLRILARTFVEGYHAAHADRISALALSGADQEQEEPGGNKQFRIVNGYDSLVEWLRAGLDPERVTTLLGTIASTVTWSGGEVAIDCRSGPRERTIRAKSALFTLPIGVWKAPREQPGTLRFDPALTQKENAVAKLEVGHVVKIILRFDERFWDGQDFLEQRGVSNDSTGLPLNFIHSQDPHVPTWWTSAPVRSPLLTAWAGGHAADRLLADRGSAVDRVLDSLSKAFGMRRRDIDTRLAGSWWHDWQSDPFSRGAYSYAGVGGTGAHKMLGKSVDNTLFFAGEATSEDQTGTVAGAIESGRKAAKQMLSRTED